MTRTFGVPDGSLGAETAPAQVLADDEVCACLDETGERRVRLYERCERCGAFMAHDAAAVQADAALIRDTLERRAALEAYAAEMGASEFEAFLNESEIQALAALDRLVAALPGTDTQ